MGTELSLVEAVIVKVRRQPGDWRLADYRLSDVKRLRWDDIGGGMQRRSQWHVYGYVMCDGMLSGKIGHSCIHGPAPHRIKVCVTKKYNEAVWPMIAEKVGEKPKPRGCNWRKRLKAKRRRDRLRRRMLVKQAKQMERDRVQPVLNAEEHRRDPPVVRRTEQCGKPPIDARHLP